MFDIIRLPYFPKNKTQWLDKGASWSFRKGMSLIRVLCIFPDNSATDIYISEVGEFLRLTKLVNGITMEGANYSVAHTELIVEKETFYISMLLKHRPWN